MADRIKWNKGGFLDNLNAAANHVGYENLPLAFGLAKVDWPNTDTRDEFLRALTRLSDGGNNGPAAA